MEQLTKNQAVATSQEAVQNQNEPQLRDENAHNDKSVHGVLNPTYQAGLRRDARSEERFSRNAETDLVCRLLLDKKTRLDGALILLQDAVKPHGLLTTTGSWLVSDRGNGSRPMPSAFVGH